MVPREHEWEPADGRSTESLWQTQTLILTPPSPPINLSYPRLNMSRVDVTLRLCRGRLSVCMCVCECGWGAVEVKCSGVCNSGDMRRKRRRGAFWGKIEGGRRRDGRQLKDHPMRGDLKARGEVLCVWPLCHTCTYSNRYMRRHAHIQVVSLEQKLA